jgi:hypothetical protein
MVAGPEVKDNRYLKSASAAWSSRRRVSPALLRSNAYPAIELHDFE